MARLTLTSFDEWLDGAVQTDVEDVYALHEAVDGETEFAQYKKPSVHQMNSSWSRMATIALG